MGLEAPLSVQKSFIQVRKVAWGGLLGLSGAILGLLRGILRGWEATFGVQRGMHWGWQAAWGGLSGHLGGH